MPPKKKISKTKSKKSAMNVATAKTVVNITAPTPRRRRNAFSASKPQPLGADHSGARSHSTDVIAGVVSQLSHNPEFATGMHIPPNRLGITHNPATDDTHLMRRVGDVEANINRLQQVGREEIGRLHTQLSQIREPIPRPPASEPARSQTAPPRERPLPRNLFPSPPPEPEIQIPMQPQKRGPGRPRINPFSKAPPKKVVLDSAGNPIIRKRGRPPKNPPKPPEPSQEG